MLTRVSRNIRKSLHEHYIPVWPRRLLNQLKLIKFCIDDCLIDSLNFLGLRVKNRC